VTYHKIRIPSKEAAGCFGKDSLRRASILNFKIHNRKVVQEEKKKKSVLFLDMEVEIRQLKFVNKTQMMPLVKFKGTFAPRRYAEMNYYLYIFLFLKKFLKEIILA